MALKPKTVMALAAHHNRIGFCYLIDREPMDWQLAHEAAKDLQRTKAKVRQWFEFYSPDLVITEDLEGSKRKGRKAQQLILAMKEVALSSGVEHVEIGRVQPFANKYLHIDELCERHPQLKAVRPKKRRIFDCEPAATTIFEAAALADKWRSQSRGKAA